MSHMLASSALPPARRDLRRFAILIPLAAAVPFVIWPQLITRVTSTQFLPHRFCYLSDSRLIWLNVLADSLIGVAYVAISATLAYLVHCARNDIPFSWMFLAFGLFIVACGGTHFMEVLTVWHPLYWLSGDVKVVTAVASVATAISLPTLVPKSLDLLTAARASAERKTQLEVANFRLSELEDISAELASRAELGIASWDWDVVTDAVHWSGDTMALFGRTSQQLATAEAFFKIVHPEDRVRVQEAIDQAFSRKEDFDSDFRIILPNGSSRWIVGRGRPHHDDSGQACSMIGVNFDVTARKQAEIALRQAEKLAAAGRLAGSIAHEINNPLSSVVNLLYLIENQSAAASPVRTHARLAQDELMRVAHIVRQTLAFHRDTATPVPVQLSEILDNVLELHFPQLKAKNIALKLRYESQAAVIAMPGELRQVFANLIANALDAVSSGGVVLVRVHDSFEHRNGCRRGVRVIVADNGAGIAPEDRQKIFEPFFTTKGEKGTGLGLWVSRGIVQKFGGDVQVRSSQLPGKSGTLFSIFLPTEPGQ